MELGKKIYELRRERGVTQEELAAELGVTAAAVSKWEKGNTLPDVLMVCALADHFGVTTDELLGRIRALKKLVVMAGEQDRKQIERVLRSRGFCAAAWAADFDEAKRLREETGALCILRIGRAFMTEQEIRQAEGCSYGDCVYDEPEDLPGNLDTILAMLEDWGIRHSMSRPYKPVDNCYIETFWKTMKVELGKTTLLTEQTYRMVVEYYIYYYNNLRPHSTLGYNPPLAA